MTSPISKTAIAALVAAAGFATSASAAEVSVYGLIDTGLSYQHIDQDNGTDSVDKFQMRSSQTTPNRWGLRGSEDLGNGWKAGFMLEGQFGSDDGTLTGGRLWQRTAQFQIGSDKYGTFVFGRSGALRSGFGTTGIWGPKVSPFSNSWGEYLSGSKYIMPGGFKAIDNAVTYVSPAFSGVQLHAQYSFKIDSVTDKNEAHVEGKHTADRQWAVGATYTQGPLHLVAIVDSILYRNDKVADYDDSLAASIGGNYDFGIVKLYASGMYFKGMKQSEFQGRTSPNGLDTMFKDASYKGYALQLGADVPLGGGTFKASIGWMDAKADQKFTDYKATTDDVDRFNLGVAYVYPLSKTFNLYAGAGYMKDSANTGDGDRDPSAYEVVTGMLMRF